MMRHWMIPTGLAALAMAFAGCGGDTTTKSTSTKTTSTKSTETSTTAGKTTAASTTTEVAKADKASATEVKGEKKEHDHGGWWCDEHGIPEEECSMCSDKVAKEMKAKGDWCEKHERAMSQCFFCKPERREFYAAKHRAKYGKEPPPVEELDAKKDAKKG